MSDGKERVEMREKMNDKEHQHIYDAIGRIEDKLVSKEEFKPVKAIVFGMVGIMLAYSMSSMFSSVVQAASSMPKIISYIEQTF